METPGNGPPRPVMVPLIVHVAAAGLPAGASVEVGGACWAPSAVPAMTRAIAAALTVVVDILVSLLALRRAARGSVRAPEPRNQDKSMSRGRLARLFTFFTCT